MLTALIEEKGLFMPAETCAFTHVGLPVGSLDTSVAFYERWARMKVVDSGDDAMGTRSVRLTDSGGGFLLSLIESPAARSLPLMAHLGMSCETRDEVDSLAEEARSEGILISGPINMDDGLGYQILVSDPDGHTVEFAHGQTLGVT